MRESRLPVGSSAKSTVGRVTSARPIATRCCCPPESSAGRWWRRSLSPTLSSSVSTHSRSGFFPAIESGSTTFSSAVRTGSRLKNWNTKPTWRRRRSVSSRSPIVVISRSSTTTSPGGRAVEPSQDVHERRLAGAGRPHDSRELALRNLQRHVIERVDRGVALAVLPGDSCRADGGGRLLAQLVVIPS